MTRNAAFFKNKLIQWDFLIINICFLFLKICLYLKLIRRFSVKFANGKSFFSSFLSKLLIDLNPCLSFHSNFFSCMKIPFISEVFLTQRREKGSTSSLWSERKTIRVIGLYLHTKVSAFQLVFQELGEENTQLCLPQIVKRQRTGRSDQSPECPP